MPQRPIELHYWPTPNGHKITIMLEECGLPYEIKPVNIGRATSSSPSSWPSRPTTACPPSSIPTGPAASRSRSSSWAPSCSISAARPASSIPPTSAPASRWSSGCSGRWPTSAPMAGQAHHFRNYAPGEDQVRHRPLHQRGEPALRRHEHAPQRTATTSPARTRSPTWRAIPGCGPTRTRARTSPSSRTSRSGSSACTTARPWPRRVKVGEELRANYNLATDKDAQKVLFGQRARK